MKKNFLLAVSLLSMLTLSQAYAQDDSLKLKIKKHKIKQTVKASPRTQVAVASKPATTPTTTVNVNTTPAAAPVKTTTTVTSQPAAHQATASTVHASSSRVVHTSTVKHVTKTVPKRTTQR